MSFEDLPYKEGDVVVVPGFTQCEGVIEHIRIEDGSGALCNIMVRMESPDVRQEYCFEEGDEWSSFFSLKGE